MNLFLMAMLMALVNIKADLFISCSPGQDATFMEQPDTCAGVQAQFLNMLEGKLSYFK
jgi:hypothetical protein